MMRLSQAASVVGGTVLGRDVPFTGVSTDTRSVGAGDLFVALRGERFDGHDFLEAAGRAGAAAAIVDRRADVSRLPFPALQVDDTRLALGALAQSWRGRFDVRLVALTGSSGKTTVKEMLASILRAADGAAEAVLATRGNLNNDIGVPLMLLELDARHRHAVIEMGMNHSGEISYLTRLARPDVALITNAGRAHIEYLGSEEAIAQAKGEIFEGLAPDGAAIINADDAYASLWRSLAGSRRVIDFGLRSAAAVRATYQARAGASEVALETASGAASFTLHAPGAHNVANALAAAAAAVALDVTPDAIATGLSRYRPFKGRLQRKAARAGAAVIDDTYNANPESVRAAIDVLAATPGRRLLVLGDMGELGLRAAQCHTEIGRYAREAGLERLFATGEQSAETVRAFGDGGTHYNEIEALIDDLGHELGRDVTVLVKGSRFMKMERVVEAIAAGQPAGAHACS